MKIDFATPLPPTRPYDPITRPWYLDLFWSFFKGRPYALNGSYGFTGSQSALTNCITTGSNPYAGGALFNVTAGQGANFTPGEVIVVGTVGNYQSFTLNNKATDALNCFPYVADRLQLGFPSGTPVGHAWGNDTHPVTSIGYQAWAQAIADSLQSQCLCGTNLLPLSGANSIGEFAGAFANDANAVNMAPGWISVTPAQISSCVQSVYAVTDLHPHARTSKSLHLTTLGTDTGGCGIQTVNAIAVKPGEVYDLSTQGKLVQTLTNGAYLAVKILDSDSATVIATATLNLGQPQSRDTFNLGTPHTLTFTVPQGTSNIKIQYLTTATAGKVTEVYLSTVRLLRSRQNTGIVAADRFVIEDPGARPILILGDSWGLVGGGFDALQGAIQNRLPNAQLISGAITGQNLTGMLGQLAQYYPLNPAYMILASGMMNDLTANRTNAAMATDMNALIDGCRAHGIIPVIPGVAPSSNAGITGGLQTCATANDYLRTNCCDNINV